MTVHYTSQESTTEMLEKPSPQSVVLQEAYISGVLHGDGWCTRNAIGLRVADYEFAEAFAYALRVVFSIPAQPRKDERGYWLLRKSNTTGRYSYLLQFVPQGDCQMSLWLRGLFDSEGNATLRLKGVSENSYGRGIEMFSTNISTLAQASIYLECLNIPSYVRPMSCGEGHKGKKPVYRLTIRGSQTNYSRFADFIGSSIPRKQQVLLAIPLSYQPDLAEHCRRAQQKGAQVKHRKLMEETVPLVLAGIRSLIQQNITPTQKHCQAIPKYGSIQPYFRQADLVALALNTEEK